MRRLALVIALLAVIGLSPALAMAEPLTVAVTIAPQEFFLRKVGGRRVNVVLLVPAGADPHVYEPKPGQMKALARAAVWFTLGLEMEQAWKSKFLAANPAMRVVATDAGIAKLDMAPHEHAGAGGALSEKPGRGHALGEEQAHGKEQKPESSRPEAHDHSLPDPHIWLSPALAKVQAAAMRDALSALDPAGAAEYASNWAVFAKECDTLTRDLTTLLTDLSSRMFMVFHPSWGYFAHDFGLAQLPIEAEGKEPSPRELARQVDEAREHNIRAIFVAPQFSRRTAEVLAREVGAGLVEADPLADDWDDNLRRVARSLAAAKSRD
jgi:zinc transport system substrate-binding protein